MTTPMSMDALVRQKLRSWPQHPPGLVDHDMGASGAWLRARPGQLDEGDDPYLKLPGSNRLRTVPDGLWLRFSGTERDPFVDIFGIMEQTPPTGYGEMLLVSQCIGAETPYEIETKKIY